MFRASEDPPNPLTKGRTEAVNAKHVHPLSSDFNLSQSAAGSSMSNVQAVKRQLQKLKKVHAFVTPFVIIPILLTLTTRSIYQALELLGKDDGAR